jgi:hypothetical protein
MPDFRNVRLDARRDIDFYVVATLIVGQFVGAVAAIIMLSAFVVGWFVLPRLRVAGD